MLWLSLSFYKSIYRENDLLLGSFADKHLDTLQDPQLKQFELLLEEIDPGKPLSICHQLVFILSYPSYSLNGICICI